MSDVTELLAALDRGEASSTEELLPLVYEELRRLAAWPARHRRQAARPGAEARIILEMWNRR